MTHPDAKRAFEEMMPEPAHTIHSHSEAGDIALFTADQLHTVMQAVWDAATERAAKTCEERATAYRYTRAPGWHEVDHECTQCAAAIRSPGRGQ